jgi:integrase
LHSPRDELVDVEQVEAVAAELDPRYAAIPSSPPAPAYDLSEWIGLHRADVDRENRVLHVRRRFSGGELKAGGKTDGSERAVPLRQRVLDALDAMPPRIAPRSCSRRA